MNFFATEGTLLESAIEYARHGFKVFPVHYIPADGGPGQISPLCAGGRIAASQDENQIRAWWTAFPDALIAVNTGAASGLLAVTLPKNKPLHTKTPSFSTFFSETCYIFQYPQDGEKPACGALDGGGSFHGEGGFIVVPPSSLAYKNAENDEVSGCYSVLQDGEIQGAPEELLEKMRLVATVEKAERETVTPKPGTPDIFRAVEKQPEPEHEQEQPKPHFSRLPALPLECLTPKLRKLIEMTSDSLGAEPWLPFAVALKMAATCIGANAILYAKRTGFKSPAHLWLCLVAPSGAGKSPCGQHFSTPINNAQIKLRENYQENLELYKDLLMKYEEEKKAWATGKSDAKKPVKPIKPPKTSYFINESTPEALISTLKDNPGGVMWSADEIKSILKSFGRYNGASEAVKSSLLSMYNGEQIEISRKTDDSIETVKEAWLSIFGTIQPEILKSTFEKADMESGFLQRFTFIFAENTGIMHQFKRNSIKESGYLVDDIFGTMAKYKRMVNKIHATEEDIIDDKLQPRVCTLEEEAEKAIFDYKETYERAADTSYKIGLIDRSEVSLVSKHIFQLMRLILCLHCIDSAEKGFCQPAATVTIETVNNAIKIFKAMIEHNKEAWRIICGKEKKEIQNFGLIETVDKYIDKKGNVYTLSFSKKVDGVSIIKKIKDEINESGIDAVASTQAFTKALEKLGFTAGREAAGVKMKISKAVYEEAISLIIKQKQQLPPRREENGEIPRGFFKEIESGLGVTI